MANVLLGITCAAFIMAVVFGIVAVLIFVKTDVKSAILFLQNKIVPTSSSGNKRMRSRKSVAYVSRTSSTIEPSPVVSQTVAPMGVSDNSKAFLKEESESPTTLLQEGSENPTTLLQEGSENPTTLLQEESENPTTLLQEESENPTTLLQEESENPTTLLVEQETERPTSLLELEESERATILLEKESMTEGGEEEEVTFKFEIKQKDLLINTDESICTEFKNNSVEDAEEK